MIKVDNLTFAYDKTKLVLENVSIEFEKGRIYCFMGPSGAGKTTLLSLLAGLMNTKGSIMFNGMDIDDIGLENHRKNNVGIVFQNYNLVPYLSAYQNVLITFEGSKLSKQDIKIRIETLFEKVGIDKSLWKRPVSKLSGGEQQRVAIVRAVAKRPSVILADEPTGNLDEVNSDKIMELFHTFAKEEEITVIIVTHSKRVASTCEEVYEIVDKKLFKI